MPELLLEEELALRLAVALELSRRGGGYCGRRNRR
jgi:hypothetical protein